MEDDIIFLGYREDDREPLDIRKMKFTTNTLDNASGSCCIEVGNTKVLAWIKGPKESRKQNLDNKGNIKCDFMISQSAYPNIRSEIKRDLQMREYSSSLKDIFEEVILLKHYPKSEIEINVAVLQHDGSYKTHAITAITIALIKAGIYIKDTAVGVSVGMVEDKFLYDLTKNEEKQPIPIINACYLPNSNKCVFTELTNSTLDFDKAEQLINSVEKIGQLIYSVVKRFLLETFKANLVEDAGIQPSLLDTNMEMSEEEY